MEIFTRLNDDTLTAENKSGEFGVDGTEHVKYLGSYLFFLHVQKAAFSRGAALSKTYSSGKFTLSAERKPGELASSRRINFRPAPHVSRCERITVSIKFGAQLR